MSVDVEPRTEKGRLEELRAKLDTSGREKAIREAMEDRSEVVRDQAVAVAVRYLEPEVLGRMMADGENAIVRNAAIEALERQGIYALPHLQEMAQGCDPEVAMFSVQVLSKIQESATIPVLIKLLEHDDENIVMSAVEALGRMKARKAVPLLIRLLESTLWVQFAAVAALGEAEDERAVGPLIAAVDNEMLAESAMEAIGKIGSSDSTEFLLKMLFHEDRIPLRDKVIQGIVKILEKNPSSVDVLRMVREYGGSGRSNSGLISYLQSAIRSRDKPLTRAASVFAIVSGMRSLYGEMLLQVTDLDDRRWLGALLHHYKDEYEAAVPDLLANYDPDVRLKALEIGSFGRASAVHVRKILADRDPSLRAAACRALGACGDEADIASLMKCLEGGTEEERNAAGEALAEFPEAKLMALDRYLKPETPLRQKLAVLNIFEFAKANVFGSSVEELLEDDEAEIRLAALRAAVNLDDDGSDERIARRLRDSNEQVRITAIWVLVRRGYREAAPVLQEMLDEEGPVRYHVIRALGHLGIVDAAEKLKGLFTEAMAHEKIEIVACLVRLAPIWIVEFLKDRLNHDHGEIRSLAADGFSKVAGPGELNALREMAECDDWNIRNHAAWGMGRLAAEEARPILLNLVRDEEPIVARTARGALARLRGGLTPGERGERSE